MPKATQVLSCRVSPALPPQGTLSWALPPRASLAFLLSCSPHEADSSERSPQSSSRSHVQEMGMQRPLAQENWLGGQVRAGDRDGRECSQLSPLFNFTCFAIILCLSGSLPKDLKAILLRDIIQNHLRGLTPDASPRLSRGRWCPPRRRSTRLACHPQPRAVLCPLKARASQPTLSSLPLCPGCPVLLSLPEAPLSSQSWLPRLPCPGD